MDMLVTATAVAFLGALTAYVAVLAFGGLRQVAETARSADTQRQVLKARIDQIMDLRQFEREQSELSWNGHRKFEVKRKHLEGGDICSFYLEPHDGKPLPPFRPGQFLTFQLQIPGQRKPVIRCYSLSDSPNQVKNSSTNYYRVSIKRVPPPRDKPDLPPGLSSNFFHDQVNEGDILDVKAPGGHFHLDMSKQTPVVLIGGGVGLTPVVSMLNAICESGSKRETHFFYGVRNGREAVMKDHLRRLAVENENVKVYLCYSDPLPTEREGDDYTNGERVSVDLFKRLLPSNNYDFYMCGPPPMMSSVVGDLEAWGVPEKNIHFEAFGPASVKKTAEAKPATESAAAAAGSKITVTFAKSGKAVPWVAGTGSILEFAEDQGVPMDSGCRAGNCGTCLTAVKSGEVEYVGSPGSMPEAGSCLVCISVPKGDIVLNA